MILSENRSPTFRDHALSFAHDLFRKRANTFREHARAEKKCAASPGGTFFILLQGLALSTRGSGAGCGLKFAASADSKGKTVGSWAGGVANACTLATPYCSFLAS